MADISLRIKSDFEQAEKDFKDLAASSEYTRKQIDKFQKSFKTEQIDKFMDRNRRNSIAIRATKGATAALEAEYKGLEREIQRLIRKGMDPQDAEMKKLINRYNKLQGEMKQTQALQKKGTSTMSTMSAGFAKFGMVAGSVAAAAYSMKKLVDITTEQQQAEGQLNAVLESTNYAAGLSAKEITNMASSLQKVTTYGDEAIIQGQNLLLTFTNIGKDVFPQATETILDMSVAFKQDLKSSAIQLGKALDNPTKGVSALSKVGVSFTNQEKEKIKTLQESGQMMEAQNMILGSLKRQTEGAARAAAQTLGGGFQQAANAIGDLIEGLGKDMGPALSGLSASFAASAASGSGLARVLGAVGKIASKVVSSIALLVDGFNTLVLLQDQNQLEMQLSLVADAAQDTAEELIELKRAGKENTQEYRALRIQLDTLGKKQQILTGQFNNNTEAQIEQSKATLQNIDALLGNVDAASNSTKMQSDMTAAINASNEAMEEATKTTGNATGANKTFIDSIKEIQMSEQAQKEQRLVEMQDFFAKRAELEGMDHEARLEFLQEQHDVVNEMDALNADQRLEAEEAINRAIEQERNNHLAKMIEFSQMTISQTGDLVGSLQQIMQNFGKESYALAIAAKGVAMAEAAINSYLAFTQVLAQPIPFPFNTIAAGITLAAGLAKQVAIATTPIPKGETGISNYTVPESRSTRLDGAAVMAQGGESVSVTPRGEESSQSQMINIQVGEEVIYRVVAKGIRTGRIDVNNKNLGKGIFV